MIHVNATISLGSIGTFLTGIATLTAAWQARSRAGKAKDQADRIEPRVEELHNLVVNGSSQIPKEEVHQ